MFDIGWQELFIIVLVGIIVIGPKELPRATRAIAGLIRKARMMAHEFQDGIDDMIQDADLDDIKKQVSSSGEILRGEVKDSFGGDESFKNDFDLSETDNSEFDQDMKLEGRNKTLTKQSDSDKNREVSDKKRIQGNQPMLPLPPLSTDE